MKNYIMILIIKNLDDGLGELNEQVASTDLGVFKFAYEVIIRLINVKLFNHINLTELFMDSTDIQNKSAYEDVGKSHKYKYKNATKINVIVNNYGIPTNPCAHGNVDYYEHSVHNNQFQSIFVKQIQMILN